MPSPCRWMCIQSRPFAVLALCLPSLPFSCLVVSSSLCLDPSDVHHLALSRLGDKKSLVWSGLVLSGADWQIARVWPNARRLDAHRHRYPVTPYFGSFLFQPKAIGKEIIRRPDLPPRRRSKSSHPSFCYSYSTFSHRRSCYPITRPVVYPGLLPSLEATNDTPSITTGRVSEAIAHDRSFRPSEKVLPQEGPALCVTLIAHNPPESWLPAPAVWTLGLDVYQ